MPCESGQRYACDGANERRPIDQLTALRCEVCGVLVTLKPIESWPETLRLWWEHHLEQDAARRRAMQQHKAQARARLLRQQQEIAQESAKLGE